MNEIQATDQLSARTKNLIIRKARIRTKADLSYAIQSCGFIIGSYRGLGIVTYTEACNWCGIYPYKYKKLNCNFSITPLISNAELDYHAELLRELRGDV
tara:strand:- start:32 stop:328 length:297 start_codon:yes stop_codon:yes gene_type:complete